VAQSNPLLLLSHAYTRYLGDLSGGRVLARVARRALELPSDGSGLQFYEFEHIHEGPKEFKNWYRRTLDGLTLTEGQVRKLVGEANVAFLLNMRMFEELDVMAEYEGAKVRPLSEALKYNDDTEEGTEANVGEDGGAKVERCPFASLSSQSKDVVMSAKSLGKGAVEKKGGRDVGKGSDNNKEGKDAKGARCPWPFILLHDPVQGMQNYQTWIVLCLLCCYIYKLGLGRMNE